MVYHKNLIRNVCTHFPDCKVSIRHQKVPDDRYGDCLKLEDGSFRIRISRNLPPDFAFEVFMHELAHAIAWDKPGSDHGPQWGKAYSQVYRAFLKESPPT